MTDAARSRRDDLRQEPQIPQGRGVSDPLAELARLVGQDDPYKGVFRPTPRAVTSAEVHAYPGHRPPAAPPEGLPAHPVELHADEAGPAYAVDAHGHPLHPDDYPDHPLDASHPVDDHEAYDHAAASGQVDEAGIGDAYAAHEAAAAAIPDLWAEDDRRPLDAAPEAARTRGGGAARRPLVVLAAVLALTGGGLAASFMAKGGATATGDAANGRGAPTILAAAGPTKVRQDDASTAAPEDRDAALLGRNAGAASGPVKVVISQEQPVDLAQLPKADLAEGARPLPPAVANPFPESKKVKTFVVHPDGTMLTDAGTPVAPPAPAPQAATPKAAPAATTPKAATIASLVGDAPAPDEAAAPAPVPSRPNRQAPAPGARAAKPAAHTDAAAPPGAAPGTFGLQLAASPSEADAHAAFTKLKKKYPAELGPLSASVHKSDTGDKPVYRVRVGGMSQDEAKALCAKLQAGGGSCFVVRN